MIRLYALLVALLASAAMVVFAFAHNATGVVLAALSAILLVFAPVIGKIAEQDPRQEDEGKKKESVSSDSPSN